MVLRHNFSVVADSLPAELAISKREGIPTEVADLRRMVAVRQEDNAASEYRLGIAKLLPIEKASRSSTALGQFLRNEATPKQRAEVLAILDRASDAMSNFEAGARKPGLDWKRKWEDGQMLLYPEYPSLKLAAKLFCAKAISLANSGRPAEGIRLVEVVYQMGRHAGLDPNLIAALVQIQIDLTATSSLCQILSRHHEMPTLDEASRAVRVMPELPGMDRALAGEMILQCTTIRDFERFNAKLQSEMGGSMDYDSPYSAFPQSYLLRDKNFLKAWEAKVLHYQIRAVLAIRENRTWAARKAAVTAVYDKQDADTSIENSLNVSTFHNLPDSPARCLANRHILATAIGLLRHRQNTGSLPKTLPRNMDETHDAFTMKKLGYKVEKAGFTVYSVDSDGVDDRGLTRREDKRGKSNTHDIAFSFR
jgi:hypothetical protein